MRHELTYPHSTAGYGLLNGYCTSCLSGTSSLQGSSTPCGSCQANYWAPANSAACTSCLSVGMSSCSATTGLATNWLLKISILFSSNYFFDFGTDKKIVHSVSPDTS